MISHPTWPHEDCRVFFFFFFFSAAAKKNKQKKTTQCVLGECELVGKQMLIRGVPKDARNVNWNAAGTTATLLPLLLKRISKRGGYGTESSSLKEGVIHLRIFFFKKGLIAVEISPFYPTWHHSNPPKQQQKKHSDTQPSYARPHGTKQCGGFLRILWHRRSSHTIGSHPTCTQAFLSHCHWTY